MVLHLRMAGEFQQLLDAGEVRSRTELARRFRLTKARITQLLDLLRLPAEILEYVRALPPGAPQRQVTERKLRALVQLPAKRQVAAAARIVPAFASSKQRHRSNAV